MENGDFCTKTRENFFKKADLGPKTRQNRVFDLFLRSEMTSKRIPFKLFLPPREPPTLRFPGRHSPAGTAHSPPPPEVQPRQVKSCIYTIIWDPQKEEVPASTF